jgi:hypothetical protein
MLLKPGHSSSFMCGGRTDQCRTTCVLRPGSDTDEEHVKVRARRRSFWKACAAQC